MKYLISLLIFNFSFSQIIKVLDNETKLPIKFAKLIFFENEKNVMGDYTDESGAFSLNINTINSIEISCQGYENQIFELKKQDNIFFLNKLLIILKEVKISNKPKKEKIIENKGKNSIEADFWISGGQDYAVFLENQFKKEVFLKSFEFNVARIDIKTNYRLHFYKSINIDGNNDEDLITDNKIYTLEVNQTGKVEIDLTELNIKIPEGGVYVCIENISPKLKYDFLINGKSELKNIFSLKAISSKNINNVFYRNAFETSNKKWNKGKNYNNRKMGMIIKFTLKVIVQD